MPKTIFITGSTDGIGLLAAKKFVSDGCNVIIHGRSSNKLEKACNEIENETGKSVEGLIADLSSLEATRALADEVRSKHSKIDVLINNAGVLKTSETILENGQDIRFVVNLLAPYVLVQKLLPIISSEGRILNLSSAAQAPVDIPALMGQKKLDDMPAYAQSKLAITVMTQQMAKAQPDGPTMIAVNPGSLLATKMVNEGFGIAGNDMNIGADILLKLSLEDEFASASGQYWDNDAGRFGAPHSAASDQNHAADIMKTVANLTSEVL